MMNCDSSCADHADDVHQVHLPAALDDRLAAAQQLCDQRNVRLTPLRTQVFTLILQSHGPIGAYELLAQMQTAQTRTGHGLDQVKPVAPPTVYRTLDFLVAQGLIHRLNSLNAYVPCCHPRDGHQAVFMICLDCQQVQEATAQAVFTDLQRVAEQGHFRPSHSTIELSGWCQQCQPHS